MSVRRNIMNVVRNYTEAEVKVREATSNDAWGPSSSLMNEIADMTYNVMAFSEIMSMIWKRVNDHGKNWRHVYKALTLLDYLIKTGSERVAQQCKENIFAIQTLKDFQFLDKDGKDQGLNVREKSKQLVVLLKDEERLKTERARAIKAKERFAQATTGIGSDHQVSYGHGSNTPKTTHRPVESGHTELSSSPVSAEIEQARPQTAGEEELQLQLALAMSKEEAEQDQKVNDSDEIRLKMAINKSATDGGTAKTATQQQSNLPDLAAAAAKLNDPWNRSPGHGTAPTTQQTADPFGVPVPAANAVPASDIWGGAAAATQVQPKQKDPWGLTPPVVVNSNDPWGGTNQQSPNHVTPNDAWETPSTTAIQPATGGNFDPFDSLLGGPVTTSAQPTTAANNLLADFGPTMNQNAFDMTGMNQGLPGQGDLLGMTTEAKPKKTANDFLGDAADLVNLDSLVTPKPTRQEVGNPFLGAAMPARGPSPTYQFPQPPAQPTINQLRGGPALRPTMGTTAAAAPVMNPGMGQQPLYGMQTNPMAMPSYGAPPVNPMMNYGMVGMGTGMMPNGNMNMTPMGSMGMQPTMGMTAGNMGSQDKANPFLL